MHLINGAVGLDRRFLILTAFVLTVGGCLALYWPALSAPFLFDDIYIVFQSHSIINIFDLDMFRHNRPLVMLSYMVNYAGGGTSPVGYHLFQIVIHGINAFFVFVLARQLWTHFQAKGTPLPKTLWWAMMAGVFYLLNPLFSMAVVLVSARSELMCVFFYLLGLILLMRGLANPNRLSWIGPSLCALGGLLSKEMIVTFPVACLLVHLWHYSLKPAAGSHFEAEKPPVLGGSFRRFWNETLVEVLKNHWKLYLALSIIDVGLVIKVLSFDWHGTVGSKILPFTRWEFLMTQVVILVRYIKVLLLPWPNWLCADWDYPVVRSVFEARFLIHLVLLTVGLFGLWLAWRKKHILLAWTGILYFVTSSPVSSVIPIADPLMEYRVYLSGVFLVLFFVEMIRLAWACLPEGHHALKRILILAGLAYFIGLGVCLRCRLNVYQTPQKFWSDTVEKSPLKTRPRMNLAQVYTGFGQLELAMQQVNVLLKTDPRNADVFDLQGDIYREMGDKNKAFLAYRQSLTLNPKLNLTAGKIANLLISDGYYDEAFEILSQFSERVKDEAYYLNLAIILSNTGKLEQAAIIYRSILGNDPRQAVAWDNLGNIYQRQGHLEKAETCYRRSLEVAPTYYLAEYNLGILKAKKRDLVSAEQCLLHARSLNPWFAWIDFELGNIYAQGRNYATAREYYQRFIERKKDHAEAWYRLGLVQIELGNTAAARSSLSQALKLNPQHKEAAQTLGQSQ